MTLIDTSVFVGLANGRSFAAPARALMIEAVTQGRFHVSVVTAWQLGLLATRTGRTSQHLGDARRFFETVVTRSRLTIVPLTADAALEAAYLPGEFHRDPNDRMIVATARVGLLTLVTDDRAILDYAAAGHVRAIAA